MVPIILPSMLNLFTANALNHSTAVWWSMHNLLVLMTKFYLKHFLVLWVKNPIWHFRVCVCVFCHKLFALKVKFLRNTFCINWTLLPDTHVTKQELFFFAKNHLPTFFFPTTNENLRPDWLMMLLMAWNAGDSHMYSIAYIAKRKDINGYGYEYV